MKKKHLFYLVFVCSLASAAFAVEQTSSIAFKYYMHQLFDNFNQSQISLRLKKYDIADIYLKHMEDTIVEVRQYIPDKDKSGAPMDKVRFNRRLDTLTGYVSALKGSVESGESAETKNLSQEVFNMCVTCHGEVGLKYLFKLPQSTSLFAQYMHKISEHLDLARIYRESEGNDKEVVEHLKLIGYYLDLLKDTFPEQGPSGVILDKKQFDSRLADIEKLNAKMIKDVEDKKAVGMDSFRVSINGLCVACHEPERLK